MLPDTRIVRASARHAKRKATVATRTHAPSARVPSAARPDTSHVNALFAMRAKPIIQKAHACVPRAVLTTGKTNARKICARTAKNSATLKSAAQGSLHRHAPHVARVRTKRPEHSIVQSTNARHARANSDQKATTISIARRARATRASFPDTYRMCARFENATTSRSIF